LNEYDSVRVAEDRVGRYFEFYSHDRFVLQHATGEVSWFSLNPTAGFGIKTLFG